jgi:hypothetical protein
VPQHLAVHNKVVPLRLAAALSVPHLHAAHPVSTTPHEGHGL